MSSDTEIANMALGHLGVGKEISDVETERSAEARACRRFLNHVRELMFRDFAWPFATKIVALALVEEDPNTEWAYSYRYPTDCLMFRRILSGIRHDTPDTRIPYRVAQDDQGKVIFTDLSEAVAEYTILEDDPTMYPPDFITAMSFLLASYIATPLTNGDPFKLGPKAFENYRIAIAAAEANAANEEQPDQTPDAESIRARE